MKKNQAAQFSYLNPRYADDKNTFGPRVHFNHGFHDATLDKSLGTARELSETVHDTRHVSPTFDRMYFEGYKAGLAQEGRPDSSEPAWVTFRTTLTESQLQEVFTAEVSAYQATWPRKDRNEYTLKGGRQDAAKVCGKMF